MRLRIICAAALASAATVLAPTAAGAAGDTQGDLYLKGPGSIYAVNGAYGSIVTTVGGTATFGFQVKNTGTETAQYNLRVQRLTYTCGGISCSPPTFAVAAGSLVFTKLTEGPHGYFTAPIDPGKVLAYTLKVTTPKTAVADDGYLFRIELDDTEGGLLSTSTAEVLIKAATTGTSAADQFVTAAGSSAIHGHAVFSDPLPAATAPAMKLGQTTTFTVKLQNNGTTPTSIFYYVQDFEGCGSLFDVKVIAGTADVTTAVFGATYSTPVLAVHGATTLKMTVKYARADTGGCLGGYQLWNGHTVAASDEQLTFMFVNKAVGSL